MLILNLPVMLKLYDIVIVRVQAISIFAVRLIYSSTLLSFNGNLTKFNLSRIYLQVYCRGCCFPFCLVAFLHAFRKYHRTVNAIVFNKEKIYRDKQQFNEALMRNKQDLT